MCFLLALADMLANQGSQGQVSQQPPANGTNPATAAPNHAASNPFASLLQNPLLMNAMSILGQQVDRSDLLLKGIELTHVCMAWEH